MTSAFVAQPRPDDLAGSPWCPRCVTAHQGVVPDEVVLGNANGIPPTRGLTLARQPAQPLERG